MLGIVGLLTVGLWAGSVPVMVPERPNDTLKAEALEREAEALFSEMDQWRKAASLLEQAAGLRAPTDPRRTEVMVLAARVYGHVGNLARAERLMLTAAEEAHARGAVAQAAEAYLNAADFAVLRRERARAATLVEKAALLAESPHLSSAQRDDILIRLPRSRAG